MSAAPEVYVIDDDPAIRLSLPFLLRSAGLGSRTFDSALAFLQVAEGLPPGCVVTDVRMPGMDGIELVRRILELNLRHPVIVMTGHGDVPLAVEAIKAGAFDFIEKPFSDEVLLGSVRAAMEAESRGARNDDARLRYIALFGALSPREREVLKLVLTGKTSKLIAHELGISPRTVEVYRASMMTKAGAKNLSELVRMGLLAGL